MASAIRGARSRSDLPGLPGVAVEGRSQVLVRGGRPATDLLPASPVGAPCSGKPCASPRAACSPAVSVPRSAAISVANSRLTSPGASSQAVSAFGDRLVGIRPIGDELLEHRHGRGTGPCRDDLGEPGQPGHGRKPGVLAQERRHLEIRVEPGLQPTERLEQERVAEQDRRMRLVGPERPLRTRAIRRQLEQRAGRPAHERRHGGGCLVIAPWYAAIVRASPIATASARHAPSPGCASRSGEPVSASEYRWRLPSSSVNVETTST